MFVRLLKNWTLPVSMTTGVLLYFIFSAIPALDGFSAVADRVITAIFPFVMMTILFATFCRVNFRALRLRRWHILLIICQLLLIATYISVSYLIPATTHSMIVHEALLVCIAAPCAAAAPVVTGKLGGDIESMTTYTLLSNILCACIIPCVFTLMPLPQNVTADGWTLFTHLARSTALVLLLPLLLAWLVKHRAPCLHKAVVAVHDLPFYLWAFSLSIVSGLTVKHILHSGVSASLLLLLAGGSLLICIIQFTFGWKLGKKYGATTESGQGLGQKNTAFAIWLAMTHFTPVSSVAPGCYILWQNIINSIEINSHRKKEVSRSI